MEKKASPEAATAGGSGDGKGLAEEEDDDVASIYCGVGQCRPRFMQVWLESLVVLNCLSISATNACILFVLVSIYCGVGQCRPRFMQVWSLVVLD